MTGPSSQRAQQWLPWFAGVVLLVLVLVLAGYLLELVAKVEAGGWKFVFAVTEVGVAIFGSSAAMTLPLRWSDQISSKQ